MSKIPILEAPESSSPIYGVDFKESEQGIVSYRCKVLRSLLEMPWERQSKERPLVSRSGRGIVEVSAQLRAR